MSGVTRASIVGVTLQLAQAVRVELTGEGKLERVHGDRVRPIATSSFGCTMWSSRVSQACACSGSSVRT